MATATTAAGTERISVAGIDHAAYTAVIGMETYARSGALEPSLVDLVKIRASQLNHCAFCLDMHHRDARERGEDQRRLDVLAGWHEAPSLYSEREQAALHLTEAVTLISEEGVPDDVWEEARTQFNDADLVHLLIVICAINVWNRLAVTTHQALPEL